MKKLSMVLISVSLVFLLSISTNTSRGNSTSQVELTSSDIQANHPIQPPV
ncbi:MAG: hypothetical protein K0Q87_2397, partial [Neobacillus sp.]|nr:hypothetical protein [Neobacillus sp.]